MTRALKAKVVLPCANEGEWARITALSLIETTRCESWRIVIVANGDTVTDFSFAERPPFRGLVEVRRSEDFLGIGGARNGGVEPGDAQFYVFLDAHCLVESPDWLDRGIACLEKHPEAAMVQPAVEEFTFDGEPSPGEPLDASRIRRFPLREYGVRWAWPYDRPWHLTDPITRCDSGEAFEVMAGGGMATFVRSDTFHALGRFDGEVRGWFHETMDYCIRAWLLGRPSLAEPGVRVLHRRKMEPSGYPRHLVSMFHGMFRTAWKYLSPRRCALAEEILIGHGCGGEVERALDLVRSGSWLDERAEHMRGRVRGDEELFSRFGVYEEPAWS